MSALFEPGEVDDPAATAQKVVHLEKTAGPLYGGTGVEGKRAYVVEVVEAWRIAYWVLAEDEQQALELAERNPVHRVRQRAQRAAYEVLDVHLLGEGTRLEGVWPPYMPVRRTDHYGVSSDPERDHPVPHTPEKGER